MSNPQVESGEARLAALRAARHALGDEARAAAIAKQHAAGKLSARERIAQLVDAGSFQEIGAFILDRWPDLGRFG